jgi:gephyrin
MQIENAATRLRISPFPMISVEDAIEILRKNVEKTEAEIINISDAQGRILYQNVKSYINLPPFRASIKDGYAVLASDGKGKRRVLCGVKAGTMVKIMIKIMIKAW